MRSSSYIICLSLLSIIAFVGNAQSIEGKWVGNFGYNIMSTRPEKLVVELFIHDDSLVTGTSHLYHGRDNYEHYTVSGVYHKADSSIYFAEETTIGVKLGFGMSNVLGNYTMRLHMTDTNMHFEGRWKENNSSLGLMNSKVWLDKPIAKKTVPIPVKDKNLQRAVNIQSLVELHEDEKDSIKIEIWDNAQIDGDVVSVYLGDSMLLHKQKLEAAHTSFYISVSHQNPICRLTMAAESQGSVPPCTAHMQITTRRKQYELDLSSDTYKSGSLEFFLKE